MTGCVFSGLQCDGTAEDTLCHRNLTAGEDCGVSGRTVCCPKSDLPRTGNRGQAKNKTSIQHTFNK